MDYTRDKLEQIIIGTLLNEYGYDKYFQRSKAVLRGELFKDKKNRFIFNTIKEMNEKGMKQTTPFDVVSYAKDNHLRFGNIHNFCCYMCELIEYNAMKEFKVFLKKLVDEYVKEQRYAKTK